MVATSIINKKRHPDNPGVFFYQQAKLPICFIGRIHLVFFNDPL